MTEQPPGGEPTEEEMRAALEEQMRRLRVEDVIMQTVATLVNLAGRRLGLGTEPGEDLSAERDLGQARTAIEACRALAPMCPAEQQDPIRQALSQLQMAYAQLAGQSGEPPMPQEPAAGPGTSPEPGGQPASPEEDERARARSRIWTPGS